MANHILRKFFFVFLYAFLLTHYCHANAEQNYIRIPIDVPVKDLDPTFTFYEASIELSEHLFIGLTEVMFNESECKVVPDLSEKWTVHENGSVYRFYLRKDVFWTKDISGDRIRPVTAYDVEWAIRRNIKPETDAPYAFALYILKNAEAIHSGNINDVSQIGVKAIDDHIVEFTLKHPASYFPYLLSLWIYRPLPANVISLHKDQWTEPQHILTNGPFMLKEWQKLSKIILTKNPHYYNAKNVSLSEIHFIIVQQSFAGLHLFNENKLDILGDGFLSIPYEKLPIISNSEQYKHEFVSFPKLSGYSYILNTLKPPLDNLPVRKALSLAVNRQLLTDIVTQCNEAPAKSFTPPILLDIPNIFKETDFGIDFDPYQAKQLLKESGYTDDQPFPELWLMHPVSENHSLIAKAIQTFFKFYLNINIKIEAKDWDEYNTIIFQEDRKKAPHITCFAWGADYPDAYNWLNDAFSYSQGFTGWKNKTYDNLVEKAGKELNRSHRSQLYKKADNILTKEEVVFIPLFFDAGKYLIKPLLKKNQIIPTYGQQLLRWQLRTN
jgi:oligopeptide transport system substrate-binding protein